MGVSNSRAGQAFRALGTALALTLSGPASGQDMAAEATATDAEADFLLPDEEIDALVAPVALFPDALLAQILVAATFPLDVIKADRFVADSADLSDADRTAAAEEQDWDPSVAVLAGGFPDVIGRMAEEINWTETLGNAMLAQTDDVLDSVQRLRAQAAATGYLDSNEAQTVAVEDDLISIAPTDPEIVYVPTYDPAMAFSAAPTGPPVVVSDGTSTTDLLVTGAMAFGAAMLVDEIFNDDDDWDDYWRGPRVIDWDDGDFRPRPGVNVDGDVNIDVDRNRIGAVDRDRLDIDRPDGWEPSRERREQAAAKLRDRDRETPRRDGAGSAGSDREDIRNKLKARGDGGDGAGLAKARAAAGERTPKAHDRTRETALASKRESAPKVKKAQDRAKASVSRPKVEQAKKKQVVAKAKSKKAPQRKAAGQATAFKKNGSGGARAKAAKNRGGKSRAAKRR
jgi:hypothetical protein